MNLKMRFERLGSTFGFSSWGLTPNPESKAKSDAAPNPLAKAAPPAKATGPRVQV